jgi:serine/threonine protein kinase
VQVAVKILKHRKAQNEREMEMIEREKKALMMLNHPNIVKLLEIIEDEEKQITYLVFEYVSGGELFSYIVSNGRLTETVARKFIRQVSLLILSQHIQPKLENQDRISEISLQQ